MHGTLSRVCAVQIAKVETTILGQCPLGVTAECDPTGPPYRIRFSLEHHGGVDRMGLEHITNVIQLLSNGKIPYQPDTDSCPGNDVKDGVTTMETENPMDKDIVNTQTTKSKDDGEDLEL
jgi:hypothetical protein